MYPHTRRRTSRTRIAAGIGVLAALLAVAASLAPVSPAQNAPAGKTTEIVAQGHKARGQGADPNIKRKSDLNDAATQLPPPAAKGGPKVRGDLCGIVADNWTPWKVQFYLNGDLQGMISPYGALSGVTFSGPTVVYARADFTDGTYTTWGPQTFQCSGEGIYRWKLE